MKKFPALLLLAASLLFVGCENNNSQKTISATATAVKTKSGETVVREPTRDEKKKANIFHNKVMEIDKNHPAPNFSKDKKTYSVLTITDDGIFNLENGVKIKMSGITCTDNGVKFIRKFFVEETEKVAYEPEGNQTSNEIIPAYIWQVSTAAMNDPEFKDFIIGPSFSGMNDTVILNSWCNIDFSSPSKHHQRYLALDKLSCNNKK